MTLNILIVEDEKIVALHISRVVRRLGHSVSGVYPTGAPAVSAAQREGCDLLITDIRIDGEPDGIETAATIRKMCGCAVIFVTAYRDMQTLRRAAEIEHEGYLVKPFREEELETLLQLAAIRRRDNGAPHRKTSIDAVYTYCRECRTLFQNDDPVDLTEKEHRLLRALLATPDGMLPHGRLDEAVWGDSPVDANARRQLVHRFKRKAPFFPLELVKGVGYRLQKSR